MLGSVLGFVLQQVPQTAAKAAAKAQPAGPMGLDWEALWREYDGWIILGGTFVLVLLLGGAKWLMDLPSNRRAKRGGPTLDPRQVEELMSGSGPVIIDLRPPQVFSAKPGHIRGAANIPLAFLPRELEKLDPREKRPVVLVDDTDELSHRAFLLLKAKGFGWVYVLKGGMKAWKKAGMPMYR